MKVVDLKTFKLDFWFDDLDSQYISTTLGRLTRTPMIWRLRFDELPGTHVGFEL